MLFAAVLLAAVFCLTVRAAPADAVRDAIPSEAEELLSGVELEEDLGDGLWSLAENAMDSLGEGELLVLIRHILAAAVICGAVCALESAVQSPVLRRVAEAAGGAAVFLLASGGSESVFAAAERAVRDMTVFSEAYTTVYTAAAAAAGAPAAAAARKAVAVFATTAFSELSGRVIFPLCGAFALLRTVGLCMEAPLLSRAAGGLRSLLLNALRLSLSLYAAAITLSGAVGAAGDSLLKRGVKGGVAAAVPIVGGVLNEACEAIFAGAAVVRNSVGTAGILVLVATAVLPLLRLGLWYAGMRLAAAVTAIMCPNALAGVTETAAETLGMYFAVLAAMTAAQLIAVFAGFLSFA